MVSTETILLTGGFHYSACLREEEKFFFYFGNLKFDNLIEKFTINPVFRATG